MKKQKIMLWIMTILLLSSFASADLSDDLQGWYSLDVDGRDSTGSFNGTVSGAVLNTTNKVVGVGSYEFDGSADYIDYGNVFDFTGDELTFGAWVYKTFDGANNAIIGKHWSKYQLRSLGNSDDFRFTLNAGSLLDLDTNGNNFQDNTWYFVVGRYNSTHMSLFIDGVEVVNRTQTGNINSNSHSFYIGSLDGSTQTFNGNIDEAFIYNRSLSDAEILEIYNSGSGISYSDISGASSNPVNHTNITLSFDNSLTEDTGNAHSWSVNGGASQASGDECLWYGCANLSATSGDSVQANSNFTLTDQFTLSYFAKPISEINGGNPMVYFSTGSGDHNTPGHFHQSENGYGMQLQFWWLNGTKYNGGLTSSDNSQTNVWSHYCTQYDGSNIVHYKNGVVMRNDTATGSINQSLGETTQIGRGQYGIDIEGYMDEFYFSTDSNFDCVAEYNTKRTGTPPAKDLYLSNFTYDLPWNFSDSLNRLTKGTSIPLNFTIKNEGENTTEPSNYEVYLNDVLLTNGTVPSLAKHETYNISYDWSTSTGYHQGTIIIDSDNLVVEDEENNNNFTFYIPFLDKPYLHFTYDEFFNEYYPYMQNTSNSVANDDYNWGRGFGCSPVSSSYIGDDVDPRGKKARECALSCLYNNYTQPESPSKTQCDNSIDHLQHWLNDVDVTSYDNVQAIHAIAEVAYTFDIMWPMLTEEQATNYSRGLHNICQQLINLPNTRPDLDNKDLIVGDNGLGLSSGMNGACLGSLGLYSSNPSLTHQRPDSYWGNNAFDEWNDREINYLRSYKDNPNATYGEGSSYFFYSITRLIENYYIYKKWGITDIDAYQNALNAMAREMVYLPLDFNHNGNDHIGETDQLLRTIQRGDSSTYEPIQSSTMLGNSLFTYLGLITNETDVKKSLLFLRNYTNSIDDDGLAYLDAYLYPQLVSEVESIPSSIDDLNHKVIFDGANDLFTIRTSFNYVNDTIIQVDGGEERMTGHSTASGYYLYALGEPFFDYIQVPYNDDVRAETWANTISLQNDYQTVEGQFSYYNQDCYIAELNQYYGMSDCPKASYENDYPDYRRLPVNVSGDVIDHFGDNNGNYATVLNWRPYFNTNNVSEYFIKVGDVLLKRSVVEGNTQEEGVYHNFININNSFNYSNISNNFTLSRGDKVVETRLLYSNESFTLEGGETPISICFGKTDCSGSNRGNSNYRRLYYYSSSSDADLVHVHNWYLNNSIEPTNTTYDGTKFLIGNSIVYMDLDNNGSINEGNWDTDAWAITEINTTHYMASGATYINYNDSELYSGNRASFIGLYTQSYNSSSENNETAQGGDEGNSSSTPSSSSNNICEDNTVSNIFLAVLAVLASGALSLARRSDPNELLVGGVLIVIVTLVLGISIIGGIC